MHQTFKGELVEMVIEGKFDDEPVLIQADHPLALGGGAVEAGDEGSGWASLTKAELIEELDAREIEYKSSATKPHMIELLEAYDASEDE